MLDDEVCYRAVRSKDARFDGIFYTGVTSTGIYCRPSCPARTPKPANVRFYRSAAQAQADGFRACRRCRPDATPGSPEWNVRADVVARAMRLIADGVVDRHGVAGLAARLGYSERHVHRTLVDELGAGPVRLARSQRAHTARVLLETATMTVTEVAFAAGFASIRQFNDTMREIYGMSPSKLREVSRHRVMDGSSGTLRLRLSYRQPANLEAVLGYLERRAIPGVEEVTGATYRRGLQLPHGTGVVELTAAAGWVDATLHLPDPRDLTTAVARCRRLLDLDADPVAVDDALQADPLLRLSVQNRPGMRLPGCVDEAELAIRAVLGQQVSVSAARTHAARLAAAYGKPLDTPVGSVTHTFPTPDVLAAADLEALRMPRRRRQTVRELATRLAEGRLRLHPGVDRDEADRALRAIPGIGPWTAGYIRMRALNDPDVFLPSDLAAVHGLNRLGWDGTAAELEQHGHAWRPWRSYALMHIWSHA